MIAAYVKKNHRDWDLHLQKLALAVRTSVQDSTKFTPSKLHLGRDITLPWDRLINLPNQPQSVEEKYDELQKILEQAQRNIRKAQRQQERTYNLRRQPLSYKVGTPVLLKTHPISCSPKRFSAKFAPKWSGPYEISKVISPLVYELQDPATGAKHGRHHISNLKKYNLFPTVSPVPLDQTSPAPRRLRPRKKIDYRQTAKQRSKK
ncbi:uncharacterized protein [Centruroides vittatus]|uniref:uncharacterized protein n=1 Tax=Centruroides vittatus TaxID=120091 RepID=UPI0035103571